MAFVLRLAAMAFVLQAGLTIGSAAIETAQTAVDARTAALCQVDSKYCH